MIEEDEKTILIVDDTPENVDVLQGLLSNYNLNIAINGKIALKIVNMDPIPDLILLDIKMPELNGFQVCEELKKNTKTKDIPVIFISALSEITDVVKSFELGAVDYITKPFNPAEVIKRVETHLALRSYQKKLENINSILEQRVKKRTKELQELNTELTIAKNKAEDLNKLKSFFIGNVSHEFRTPLISILGFSEIMLQEATDPEHAQFCEMILESGQRLDKTLNDIIALTELENKKLEITFYSINIASILNKWKKQYSALAEKKELSFEIKCGFDELWFDTDEYLLTYLMNNIVDNAIKFTNNGSIQVVLSELIENSNSYLVIQVSDTGIGISQENMEIIFSSFRQESEGYDRPFEGMGIGLTVARQLVDVLKGDMSISSKPGEGTVVTLKFPLAQSDEYVTLQINQAKQLIDEQLIATSISKPILLIVEPNESNRFLFKKMLQSDFIVEDAADGISAVAMSEMKVYNLILIDINLGPEIDCIQTLRRIRKLPNCKNIPIIALTVFYSKEDKARYIDYGFDDFIQKPVLKEEFLLLLKHYV